MDNNDNKHTEAESLFATRRKKQQEEEAEKAKLEELERQKQQMAAEIARLEQMQAAQAAQPGSTPNKKKMMTVGIAAAGAVLLTAVIGIALSKTAGRSSSGIVTETAASSETTAASEISPAETTSEKKKETSAEHKTEQTESKLSENELSLDGNTLNGHRYEFINEDISWVDARERCYYMGGHLATISSDEEEAFLEQLADNNNAWIGAYYGGDSWYWVTDEPWVYENWAPGEPNNSDGEEWCCQFSKNQDMYWNDVGDYDPRDDHDGFICEYDDLTDIVYGSDRGGYYEEPNDYSEYEDYSESSFMQMLNSCEWNTTSSADGSFSFDIPSFFEYSGDDYYYYTDSSGETTACFIELFPGFLDGSDSSERDEALTELLYMIGEDSFGISRDGGSLMWYDGDTVYAFITEDNYCCILVCGYTDNNAVVFSCTSDAYSEYGGYITESDMLYFFDIIRGSITCGVG